MTSKETLPTTRRLIVTWLILMTLTLLSMVSAQLANTAVWMPLPLYAAVLILLSTGIKSQQVLMTYLNLRASSGGWKGGFICLLIVTLLLIFSGYVVAGLQ